MPPWPTVPPPPPGPLSATGRDVLDTIEQIATSTPVTERVLWAQKLTDLQAITAAAYDAMASMIADAQPEGRDRTAPGTLTLTELEHVTGWSRATVVRMVRTGRERRQQDASGR